MSTDPAYRTMATPIDDATFQFADDILDREVGQEDTAERYGRWARRFEAWRPGGEINADMLRDFDSFLDDEIQTDYPWENARGRSPPASYAYATRVSALSGVKLWSEYHYDSRIEKEVQNLARGKPADFDPTILNPAEINDVFRNAEGACSNKDCRTAVAVGYDLILRGAELADMRLEDVDTGDHTIFVRAKKGSESMRIEVGDEAWMNLASHLQGIGDREFLFHNNYDNPWTAASWNQHFRRQHHPAGFHAFARHSAISNRLKDGKPFGDVYLRARHQSPSTTLQYIETIGDSVDVDLPDWVDQ